MPRCRSAACAALLALAGGLLPAGAGAARPVVELLAIAANENGASGGHAALRVDSRVFHYQAEGGHLYLVRERWPDFRFRYRVLENRSLHASRLALSAPEARALEHRLDRRLWREDGERRQLADLRRDVALLEGLARRARGEEAALPLPGSGFFAEGAAPPGSAGAAALRALARRIAREHGDDFARRRQREADAALRALSYEPLAAPAANTLAGAPSFSRRYEEILSARQALALLQRAPALRAEALAPLPDRVAPLTPAERRALRALRRALEGELARLVTSQRPDWGSAFALGLARLAALAESLASGHLVVLDALPATAPRASAATVARSAEPQRRPLARRRAALDAARRRTAAPAAPESVLAGLEGAASRYAELARALTRGHALRLASGPLVPRGDALHRALPRPDASATELERALDAARARAREAGDAHARRYDYDLLSRNCVTELLREMEGALGAPLVAQGDPLGRLRFIPFVAVRAVARGGWVSETRRLPSHRLERLAALRAAERGWLARLREASPFTSAHYETSPADSPFLFFGDGPVWTRPLLGAANLGFGLAHGTLGLLRLPWDGGAQLVRGARGAAASLPELVFVSIRKGTFPFAAPPADAPVPGPGGTLAAAPAEAP